MITFREASASDAAAIGIVHVTSWRETYANLLPDELLNGLSAEERSEMWRAILQDCGASGEIAVFIAEEENGLIGFGACGVQREESLKEQGFDGEFGAIYVLRTHQGGGVGKTLMGLMARKLLKRGRTGAALWVLRENVSARGFYHRLGATEVSEREAAESGVLAVEFAYGWNGLSLLVANSA